MRNRPYKFLDAFEKGDNEIFFGRDQEIEEIHSRIYFSNILVIYGPSGTGKTSVLKCGLSNRIPESDWKPVFIRKNENIINSVEHELRKLAITPFKDSFSVEKKLRSIYLDYLTPIFLIFDQLEELFVFGNDEEKNDFVSFIFSVIRNTENSIKVIFIIREEYLADLSSFESRLPNILDNRVRIERMGRVQLFDAIKRPAEVCNVVLDEDIAGMVIDETADSKGNVELTYIQLLMDHLYKTAQARNPEMVHIKMSDLEKVGKLGNVISNFLDEQLNNADDPKTGEDTLKTLITIDGTKRPMRLFEIENSLNQLNKKHSHEKVLNIVQYFVKVRILKEKDDNGFYELRHDSLASIVFEKMSMLEKETIEINQMLGQSFERYKRRKVLLSQDDLNYIAPYENRLYPERRIKEFIQLSKDELQRSVKRKRQLVMIITFSLLILLSGFAIWAQRERTIAIKQKEISEAHRKSAEFAKMRAVNAYQDALDSIYVNILTSLTISPDNMNVLFKDIWNPLSISVSGIPPEFITPTVISNNARLRGGNSNFEIKPFGSDTLVEIKVNGRTKLGEELNFGNRYFRIKNLPLPEMAICDKSDGIVTIEGLRADNTVQIASSDFYFKGVDYEIISFKIGFMNGAKLESHQFNKNIIPFDFIDYLEKSIDFSTPVLRKLFIEDILVKVNYKAEPISLPVKTYGLISSKYSLADIELNEDIIKLMHKSQEYITTNPYLAYRFAEAAYIADSTRHDVTRNLVETYRYAFANVKKVFKFKEDDVLFFSFELNYLLRVFGDENNLGWQLYKVFDDSLCLTAENSYADAGFVNNRYNVIMSDDRFVISRLIKNSSTDLINLFSFYNFSGELLKSEIINQFSLFSEIDRGEKYFVSIPNTLNQFISGEYDSRATLWDIEKGVLYYLWGNQNVNFTDLKNKGENVDLIGHATFNYNSTKIVSSDYQNKRILVYVIDEGMPLKGISMSIFPKKAVLNPLNEIFVFGRFKEDNNYNSVFKVDTLNKVTLLFDSVYSFSYSRDGRYYLMSSDDSKGRRVSRLFDYTLNILQEFPTDMPNGIIKVDFEKKVLYHLMIDDFGHPRQQISLPLFNRYNYILKTINENKFYGKAPPLTLEDLMNLPISTNLTEKILDF